jgi:hypothetical protein
MIADTQAQVEAPFEYAECLAALARRQQEIEVFVARSR